MARECAFCFRSAKITGEHVWPKWIGKVIKSKNFRFVQRNQHGVPVGEWTSPEVNLKAKVVCKECNEGWMSDLENIHAKPAMADLIAGGRELALSQSWAKSLACFAFKSAVVTDHMRGMEPFFPRSARHEFAKALTIPSNAQMWFAGFLPIGSGRFQTWYGNFSAQAPHRLEMYVCTYAVGHLIFQVVSAFCEGFSSFIPREGFEHLAIPFWPEIPRGISWPPLDVLKNKADFNLFSARWSTIQPRY